MPRMGKIVHFAFQILAQNLVLFTFRFTVIAQMIFWASITLQRCPNFGLAYFRFLRKIETALMPMRVKIINAQMPTIFISEKKVI